MDRSGEMRSERLTASKTSPCPDAGPVGRSWITDAVSVSQFAMRASPYARALPHQILPNI